MKFTLSRSPMPSSTGGRSAGRQAWPKVLAAVFWLLAALSVTYWGLKWTSRPAWVMVQSNVGTPAEADPVSVSRLLGSFPGNAPEIAAAPAVPTRFELLGVAVQPGGQGAALISIDGKPPKPYRVGAMVADGLVLQGIDPQRAWFGPSATAKATLELPMPVLPALPDLLAR